MFRNLRRQFNLRNKKKPQSRPTRRRRLRSELLEDRRLLAVGDLLDSLYPIGDGAQSGTNEGHSVAVTSQYIFSGKPRADVGGTTDSGTVEVYDAATRVHLFTIENPTPEINDYFGSSIAANGDKLVVGAYGDNTGATDAGSAYVYDLSSGSVRLTSAINNPTPAGGDDFGRSLALSGDTLVVGAYGDDSGASDAGSVYVYDLAANSHTPTATINNPSPAVGDYFGWSVAVSGDMVAVGAYRDDTGASNAGSAYVYDLSVSTTTPTATINNPGPAFGKTDDYFGYSVAVNGNSVVVGAILDDIGASNSGSVYVYDISSSSSTPSATFSNPDPAGGDRFGISVAISGDTLIVGANYDDTGASNAGSAYVYDLGSGLTIPSAALNNPAPDDGDQFGWSIATSGDKIVIGAYQDDNGSGSAGNAYVYELAGGSATLTGSVSHPTQNFGDAYAFFGRAIAASGNKVVIGADGDNSGANDAGSAYVYELNGGSASLLAKIENPAPGSGDVFGHAVAISGNIVVVGAYQDDTGAPNAGSAYVYDLSVSLAEPIAVLNNPAPASDDYFGWAVAVSGEKVVVGAYGNDATTINSGTAYVYDLSVGYDTPVATIEDPNATAYGEFGVSVAISGNSVVIGARGATNAGSVHLYDLSDISSTPLATFNNPTPAANDEFGSSIAMSGSTLVVGARYDDTLASNSGAVYLYDLFNGTSTPVATIDNPTPGTNEYFGSSVAVDGNTVVVGVNPNNAGATNAGAAYLYELPVTSPTLVAVIDNPDPTTNDWFGSSVALSNGVVIAGAYQNDGQRIDQGAAYIFETPPTNTAPIATDDALTTEVDSPVTFNVLADNGNGADFDPDGNLDTTLTVALSDPAGGVLFDLGNGTFRFEPSPGFSGPDVFTYQIEDTDGATATAEVYIEVTPSNLPPEFDQASYVFSLDENSDIDSLVGIVSAIDPDADAMVYSIVSGNTDNAFKIDPTTGDISVDNGLAIDFEANPVFNLTVQVDDQNGEDNSTNTASVTIALNDLQTMLSISNASNASQEAFGEANFQVTASGDALGFGFDVTYETVAGTATSDTTGIGGGDYAPHSGVLSFAGNDGEFLLVDVFLNDDTVVENTENFFVQLLAVTGTNDVTIVDGTGEATILDDDSATINLGDATVAEGDSGTTTLSFPVALSQIADADLTFDYQTLDGTASVSDGDYNALASTFTLPAGSTAGQIDVVISGDSRVELDETFTLLADNLQTGGRSVELVGTGNGGSFSILDDFQAAAVGTAVNGNVASNGQTWSADSLFVLAEDPEDASNLVLTNASSVSSDKNALLPLSNTGTGTNKTVTLYYQVKADVASGYGTGVGFYDGDGTANQLKTAWTQLVDGPGIRALGANPPQDIQGIGEDDWYDVWLVLDLADDSNPQSNDRMKAYIAGPGIDGQVPLTHGNGAGDEFRFNSYGGSGMTDLVLFAHGGSQSASKFFLDNFYIDSTGVNLSSPLAAATATATIVNDDSITLTVGDATVVEGDSGTTTLSFPVTLNQVVDVDVTFDYQTQDGSATTADGDYAGITTPASFTIAAGSTTGQIDIAVHSDLAVEIDETIELVLSNLDASGRNVVLTQTVVDQENLRDPGSMSASETRTYHQEVIVGESGLLAGVEIFTSGAGEFDFAIRTGPLVQLDPALFSTRVNAPSGGAHYIDVSSAGLTLEAGERFAFEVQGVGGGPTGGFRFNPFDEYPGAFRRNGTTAGVLTHDFVFRTHMKQSGVSDISAAGTILNDDQSLLSISDISQAEGGVFEFTVTTDRLVSEDITFAWGTFETPGQADYDADFSRVAIEPATIPAGSLSTTFTVDVVDDSVVEPDEFFRVQIYNEGIAGVASPGRVAIAERHALGMIVNDDYAPVANAGGPYAIDEGSSLDLDATASSDANGDSLSYRWDVDGDGDFDENITGAAPQLSWTQLANLGIDDGPDSRQVTVEVSDGANISTANQILTVNNVAPEAANDTFSASEDDTLFVAAPGLVGNDADANALDVLTVVAVDLSGTRGIVNFNSDGSFSYDPDGKFEFLSAGENKDDTFTYTLSDDDGDTDTATVTVTVTGTNDAPYVFNLDPSANEDGPPISIPAIFNDERFDTHTYSIDTTGTLGSVTNNSDGTFSYDPNGAFESLADGQTASDSFTYTVTDNHGASATGTVSLTINGQNDAPVASSDAISATEDGAIVTTGRLASDVDDDDDASSLSLTITAQPAAGSASVNADGTLSFDPGSAFQQLSEGETKQVSFEFTASDRHGATSNVGTVSVTVTGTNDAPYVFNLDPTANEDGPPISIPAIFNDERFDTHTYSIDTTGTLGSVTNNSDGTFSYNPNGAFESLADGQTASDSFTYTVTDNHGASATGTVELTITGQNDAATISGDSSGAIQEDSTHDVTGKLAVADVDAGEDGFEIANLAGGYGVFTIDASGNWTYQLDNADVQYLNDGETEVDSFSVSSIDGTAGELITITIVGGNDSDTDGVDDSIEAAAGDGNGDGVQDSEQDNVASLPNAVSQTYVTIAADADADLTQVAATSSPSATQPPANIQFPIGFIQFTVSVPSPGDSADVTLYFDENEAFNSVYKFGPTATNPTPHYYEFTYDAATNTGAEFFADRVVLHLVDGGAGDADGLANGLISDPVALALASGQAGDDFVTTLEDQAVTFDPLLNDTLALDQTIVSVTTADFGTVDINDDGTLSYNPNTGFHGTDSFEYQVRTAAGQIETAKVSIAVKNLVDVSGRVFDDLDNDGIFEPFDGDKGIPGVNVQIWNDSLTELLAEAETDGEGVYEIDSNLHHGTYRIIEAVDELSELGLLDGKEAAGNLGGHVDNSIDSNVIENLNVGAPGTTPDAVDYLFAEIRPSDLVGFVWQDLNNNGLIDLGELPIEAAKVTLHGTDDRGTAIAPSTDFTDSDGAYAFFNLRPSGAAGYEVRQVQPSDFNDGLDSAGQVNGVPTGYSAENDSLAGIAMTEPGSSATNYNFGERPLDGGAIQAGQTAGIGFWHNKRGQRLIEQVGGSESSTQLGNWLATTLPNLYGDLAGVPNTGIAEFYIELFRRNKKNSAGGGPPKVDAQVMATALSAYVTSEALAGDIAEGYGFRVTTHGLSVQSVDIGESGAAFGQANGSRMQVIDLLLAVDARSSAGVLYDLNQDGDTDDEDETLFRTLANNLFAEINESGSI